MMNSIGLSIAFIVMFLSVGLVIGVYVGISHGDDKCEKWYALGVLLFVLSLGSMIWSSAQVKNNYTYKITVSRGRGYQIFYTNEYKIENGVIYFEGGCANNFTIIKIK